MSKTVIYGARRGEHDDDVLKGYQQVENEPIRLQDRQIVGILYSISGNRMGELFPVYAGRNTIGRDPDCDICLPEQSVSPRHAVLLMRRINLSDGTVAASSTITDYDSESGTWVDGRRVEFDKEDCRDHCVIQVGSHYQLLSVELDPEAYGLVNSPLFKAVPRPKPQQPVIPMGGFSGFTAPAAPEEHYPDVIGAGDEQAFYGRSKPRDIDHGTKKTQGL